MIDKGRRLIVSKAWDLLTFDDVKAHQTQLLSDPDFDPEFNELLDLSAVTAIDMSADEERILAGRRVFSSSSRRAFVASRPANFGMARLFEAYHQMSQAPSQIRVFYDLASALKWLGLDSPRL